MPPILPTTPSSGGTATLLRVSHLSVAYHSAAGHVLPALREISFDIPDGEVIGVLGESGCGKSTLALSLLKLLPSGTHVGGEILFHDHDILRLREPELRRLRGAKIALIHQESSLALSPLLRVGVQISEILRAHTDLKAKARRQEVLRALQEVQLEEAERIYNAYPHQLSGGELHRVAIAQAVVCKPDLVIADESTRSLDSRTQSEILHLLRELNQKLGTAILLITHNPAILAGFAQRVLVMHAGRIVEKGQLAQVFRNPLHPYTKGLLQLVPQSLCSGNRVPAVLVPASSDCTEYSSALVPEESF